MANEIDAGLYDTLNYLAGTMDKEVKSGGREAIATNVKADRSKGRKVRYARIPDLDACPFCDMLASRGFVYHSDASAGGGASHGTEFDRYHPFCNCQIAVSFDVVLEEYWAGFTTKVTRGYAKEAEVSTAGRSTGELREVDIDELYEQYRQQAKSFKSPPSKLKPKVSRKPSADKNSTWWQSLNLVNNEQQMIDFLYGAGDEFEFAHDVSNTELRRRITTALRWANEHRRKDLIDVIREVESEIRD